MFYSSLFLWGQMGAERCTLFIWVDWWAASLLGGFLHKLGMNQLIWEFFSSAFWFPVSPWFGWYFECWHFQPMLCSGGFLMNFSCNFYSFPWSFNQLLKISQVWLQVAFWRESGYSSTASADLFELPCKDILWIVCKWRECWLES